MIKVGERVKFISDTGVGVVRSIKNGIAQVEVDGFEIPALVSDIVAVDLEDEVTVKRRIGPDEPHQRRSITSRADSSKSTYGKIAIDDDFEDEPIDIQLLRRQYSSHQKSATPDQSAPVPKIEKPPFQLTDYKALLMFVPTTMDKLPEECDLDMYLVNDSSYEIFYSIGIWERQNYLKTLGSGKLEADTKQKLHTFKRVSLANIIKLQAVLLPCKPVSYTPQEVTQIDLELHPLKFVRPSNYTENDYFDERSFTFTLADNTSK